MHQCLGSLLIQWLRQQQHKSIGSTRHVAGSGKGDPRQLGELWQGHIFGQLGHIDKVKPLAVGKDG